jgi:hypothetical protein
MSRDLTAHDRISDAKQPPLIGARVQLNRHVYGHVVGARGIVVRGPIRKGKVLVRFDDTGYQISVPYEALGPAEPPA